MDDPTLDRQSDGEQPIEFPREQFLGLLRSGIWPQGALAYLGVSPAEWRSAKQRDPTLIVAARRASAAFELIHVRNLHEKIQKANDWRGSAWWLAQRFPKRYGKDRQGDGNAGRSLAALDRALREEFSDPLDFVRLERVFRTLGEGAGREE